MKPLADYVENPERLILFLEKLRKSLIQLTVVVLVLALTGYALSRDILDGLQRHTGVTLAYYALTETFFALLTIALAFGLAAGFPFFLYKLLAAVQAVFAGFSAKMKWGFWVAANVLFYLGALFCLFITLPYGVTFLLGFQSRNLEALISVQKFISFCLTFIFAFGIVFELPLVMVLLGRIGLVRVELFTRNRRYAVLIITALAAIVTPTPDAFNLLLMAVPLYVLYELGVIGMRLFGKPAAWS